jgi:pimeloyl-ACP methyl ester carboxylesterase
MIPLVLLHGFPFDSSLWTPVRALLSPDTNVYAPDLPGFGAEAPLPAVSIDALADWLADWLTARGVSGPVALAGHSMGGYVALAFAARHRARVGGLGLIHSTAAPDLPEKRTTRDEQIAHVEAHGPARLVPKLIAPLVAEANAERLKPVLDGFIATAAALPGATMAAIIGALRDRPDRCDVLRRAHFPVLLVMGAHDPIVTPAAATDLYHLIRPAAGRRFDELPTSAHLGMLEDPAAVATALTSLVGAAACGPDPTRFDGRLMGGRGQ